MASINLQGDTSGSISISAPSVAGSNTLTLPASTQTLATQNSLGVRNRIINGAMVIDQRNAGASVTPSSFAYTLDRWQAVQTTASKFSVQQNAGSVTPPAEFTNYLGVTSLSAYSVGASDTFNILQSIEGFNCADLAWGTSSAKAVTLSFWVRSSLTGTFGGAIKDGSSTNAYPFTYTISVANTWEYKTVNITAPTSGQFSYTSTTNGIGLQIVFGLGAGANFSGTAGAWAAFNAYTATGATSVVGTNGATFYITGVQLEVGTEATPFEVRPYDMELARCQMYYTKISATSSYTGFATGMATSTTAGQFGLMYPTTMRANPTIAFSNVGINYPSQASATLTGQFTGNNSAMVQFSSTGLTTNQALVVNANNNASAYIDMSSEL